jgi:LysR family transcriptional regulator, cyn operon transcriptional activator
MKLNVDQLRTFVSVVDAGGIHRAAARINLSQPALSRQILALEAALGIPLFDRVGRRLKLTAEGEDLLRLSRHLLGESPVRLSGRYRRGPGRYASPGP